MLLQVLTLLFHNPYFKFDHELDELKKNMFSELVLFLLYKHIKKLLKLCNYDGLFASSYYLMQFKNIQN